MDALRNISALVGLISVGFCIQCVSARAFSNPYNRWDTQGSGLLSADIGLGLGVNAFFATFSENLYAQMMRNNAFRMIFNGRVNRDIAANIGTTLGEAFAQEFRLDAYETRRVFVNSLKSINTGAGAETYANVIANISSHILYNCNILNGYNANFQSLANTVFNIVIGCVSNAVGIDSNLDDMFDIFDEDDADLRTNSNLGIGLGSRLNAGLAAAGINAGAELGTGLNAGLGLGTGLNAGLGLGVGLNAGLGVSANTNLGIGAGIGINAGLGAGLNTGLGFGGDINAGLDIGAGLTAGLGLGVGLNAGLGAGLNVGLGVGTNANASLSLESAMVIFKQRLMYELLKDRCFKAVFSDSIPAGAVSSLASAIAQFLSKAFSVPRSNLLTLENDISMLVRNDLSSPEAYAEGISISLTKLLAAANLLAPSAIKIQLSMASKAITSGIQNFLGSSKVAGVGLGIGNNPYNSYFSVLSGLEMLPYVGPDAVSRKYPPILKAAKSSKFGTKFSKALYSNLISSSKFTEKFVLGTPAPAWKRIAKSLGKNMAEAFGSPNPSFFVDTYANALLSVGDKLSYKIYARVLSLATAKALYALGYFLSGNPNIQAAIANNAIVLAITDKRSKSNYQQTSTYLGLPWMTQIAGVPPPSAQTSNNDKEGINVNANVDAGVGVGVGLGVGTDVGVGVNSGLGLDVNAGLGLDVNAGLGLDVNTGLGLDVNAGLGLDANVGFGAGLYDETRNNFMKRRRRRDILNANAGLGVAADVNANIGAAVDASGAALNTNVGLGVGANVGLGLGVGVGANVGLGGKGSSTLQRRNDIFLSVLEILPQLLSQKLYSSTAIFTAMNIVGSRKVANLIAQGFAAQFGLQSATAFSNTYDLSLANTVDGNNAASISVIATATTNALGTAGILNTSFTLLTADQLATAVVTKFSSLIATSLDSKDWNVGEKWSHIYDQDFIDPPTRGFKYLRPNAFSEFGKSLDDAVSFDFGLSNSASTSSSARSRILL